MGKSLPQLSTGLPASILTLKYIYITSLTCHTSTENLQLTPHFTKTKNQRPGPNRSLVTGLSLPDLISCCLVACFWRLGHKALLFCDLASMLPPQFLLVWNPLPSDILIARSLTSPGLGSNATSLPDLTIPTPFILLFCDHECRPNHAL